MAAELWPPLQSIFGQDLTGEPFTYDLARGPHWLIGGTTGSGKSVYINALLLALIWHNDPSTLRISAIDPKFLEFACYNDLPYCPIDTIVNMGDAFGFMLYLTWMMDARNKLFAVAGVKNLTEFNSWVPKNQRDIDGLERQYVIELSEAKLLPAGISHKDALVLLHEHGLRFNAPMAFWVLVIDEFADLIGQFADVADPLQRLAQKARSAGISVILATQRPSVDILPGKIKTNLSARIGLRVSSSGDSYVMLDRPGAEVLKGYGDSLIMLPDGTDPFPRIQGAFITDEEIDRIFTYLRDTFGTPKKLDYKTPLVAMGLMQWEEEYSEDVEMDKRHIIAPPRSRIGSFR